MSSAEQTVRSEPSSNPEVPLSLMLVGLFALLSSVGIFLDAGANLLFTQGPDGSWIVHALTALYAALLAVAGCRLWHGSMLALDFLLVSWVSSFLLPTLGWGLSDLFETHDFLLLWAVAGTLWLALIVYLIRWRCRWRRGDG